VSLRFWPWSGPGGNAFALVEYYDEEDAHVRLECHRCHQCVGLYSGLGALGSSGAFFREAEDHEKSCPARAEAEA
jgi:hypothetical protein